MTLHPWDGTTPHGWKVPDASISAGLVIDDAGTVYYYRQGDPEPQLWCTARELDAHVHRLCQIMGRWPQ